MANYRLFAFILAVPLIGIVASSVLRNHFDDQLREVLRAKAAQTDQASDPELSKRIEASTLADICNNAQANAGLEEVCGTRSSCPMSRTRAD